MPTPSTAYPVADPPLPSGPIPATIPLKASHPTTPLADSALPGSTTSSLPPALLFPLSPLTFPPSHNRDTKVGAHAPSLYSTTGKPSPPLASSATILFRLPIWPISSRVLGQREWQSRAQSASVLACAAQRRVTPLPPRAYKFQVTDSDARAHLDKPPAHRVVSRTRLLPDCHLLLICVLLCVTCLTQSVADWQYRSKLG
ncbi:hypothetical protein FRC08_000040 [Ceratobasidium sp. 394]|nr:hypothetical protein FRC08_000040 [Ceratobasidium sp. 394]